MAQPIPVEELHDFKHCPLCQPFRRKRPFDLFPWLAGIAALTILAAFCFSLFAPVTPRWVRILITTLYWLSVVAFGPWVILRWRNTYFRWRTVCVMFVQTVIGMILAGPFAAGWGIPLLLRRLHLTWPLHMSVLMPAQLSNLQTFLYGALMSLLIWPLAALLIGKRYCSWFCACGNLAETAGEAFRTRGPKGPKAQRLDVTFYVILGLATIVTLAAWLKITAPSKWYYWGVGFLLTDLVGLGMYPILGSRPWCRFFCPLTAGLGFLSSRGRFAIFTDSQRCIECGTCNRYCEMGIDIRLRARQGIPLKDDQCVACGACIAVCPRYALSFRPFPGPEKALAALNTRRFSKPFRREIATPRHSQG